MLFEHCWFENYFYATTPAVEISGNSQGVVLDDCVFGQNRSDPDNDIYAVHVAGPATGVVLSNLSVRLPKAAGSTPCVVVDGSSEGTGSDVVIIGGSLIDNLDNLPQLPRTSPLPVVDNSPATTTSRLTLFGGGSRVRPPRLTTAARDALYAPLDGDAIWNIDAKRGEVFSSGGWTTPVTEIGSVTVLGSGSVAPTTLATPPVTGLYRVVAYGRVLAGVGTLTITVSWTDKGSGLPPPPVPMSQSIVTTGGVDTGSLILNSQFYDIKYSITVVGVSSYSAELRVERV